MPARTVSPRPWTFRIPEGTLEAVKWLALASMLWDHAIRFLLSGPYYGPATAFGRLAFPLFVLILAYNLARPGMAWSVHRRMIVRLLGFGLLSVPAYWYLLGPYPLNILFTLALFVGIVAVWEKHPGWYGAFGAFLLFWFGGAVVEYGWQGLFLALSAYTWFRTGGVLWSTALLAGGFIGLSMANWSHWGTLALPIFLFAPMVTLRLPRHKWFFYAFYPIHLSIIALILFWMGR